MSIADEHTHILGKGQIPLSPLPLHSAIAFGSSFRPVCNQRKALIALFNRETISFCRLHWHLSPANTLKLKLWPRQVNSVIPITHDGLVGHYLIRLKGACMRRFILADEEQRVFYFSRLISDTEVAMRNVRLVHKGSHLRWLPAESPVLRECIYASWMRTSFKHAMKRNQLYADFGVASAAGHSREAVGIASKYISQ